MRDAKVPPKGTLVVGRTSVRVERARETAPEPAWHDDHFGPMVGGAASMRTLYARLARAAASELSVLVHGETGTGKELVARALHDASPRARGPFVIVDCAALPENLVESELFGHARGAFTGADRVKIGAAEEAEGGTLFFDEIAELPLLVQPKLLRLLEQRELRRVGETKTRPVDVRFVSATHKDLGALVNAGLFREDLYFRLAAVTLRVPSLRERPEDLPELVRHFAAGRLEPGAALALARELATRPLPGNVRELRHRVERYLALGEISTSRSHAGLATTPPLGVGSDEVPLDVPWKELRDAHLERLERAYVAGLLARHERNVTRVAEAAGLARSYVHKLIKRYDL